MGLGQNWDKVMNGPMRKNKSTKSNSGKRSILFISALDFWSLGKGKGGPALYKALTGYAQRGWEVYFITGNRANGDNEAHHLNIQVIRFDAPWLKRLMKIRKVGFFTRAVWWLYFQVVAFLKAIKLHRTVKFDVVYGYEIYGTPVAKVLSKLWSTPMVARFQGSIVQLLWKGKPFWRIRAWEHVLAFKTSRFSDIVIMTNDGSQGDQLLSQMNVDARKIRFWMNGVDWSLFEEMLGYSDAKKKLNINAKNVLLVISRLVSIKRVDRSIQALPEVLKEFPDVLLLIVGDGNERERLEKLAEELGVSDNVRFEGAVPHKDVPLYLAAADVFLSFYDWSNVGNPLLEAMMAGKSIITLNNGDTGQFITNGVNGILLEYEDIPNLPTIIKNLLSDRGLRERLGGNARKFAEEHFWSWEERIEAEIREVRMLVEKRRERE